MIWTKTTWFIYRRLRPFWLSGKTINTNIAIGFARINYYLLYRYKISPEIFFFFAFSMKSDKKFWEIFCMAANLRPRSKLFASCFFFFHPIPWFLNVKPTKIWKLFPPLSLNDWVRFFLPIFSTIFYPQVVKELELGVWGKTKKNQPKK